MRFKTKKIKKNTFRVTSDLYNEIATLCESKNICKANFVEKTINDYFLNFKDEIPYFKVNKTIKKTKRIYFRTTLETHSNINALCVERKISLSSFMNFIVCKQVLKEKDKRKNSTTKKQNTDESNLNKINKRGRPSNKEVFYKYTDDKRIVNSFSDLKLNDIIYIVPNEFNKSPKEKYKTTRTPSDCIVLPTLKKIKIHSFEVRGKFIMINRKSFNSNQFELELTINEYYNTLQVSKNGCVYSCLKSMYEEAKNKIVEDEIKSRLEKINNLNIEIELIKNL